MTPYLSLILPAYNEVNSIRRTLDLTRAFLDGKGSNYEILVAADGTDGTHEVAQDLALRDPRLHVLGQPRRGGKGRGIRRAVARARGHIIGYADADYKTPIEDLDRLLPWLERGYDLAIGSRVVAGAGDEPRPPLFRRLGARAFALGLHLAVGLWHVRDTQCGFKFFKGPVARDLFSRQRVDGYLFDVEVLYLAARLGYRVKEVGVRWQTDGDSRLDLVRGTWRNLEDVLRIRLSGVPAPRDEDDRGARAGSAA